MGIDYRVLGPLSVVTDGVEARLGGPRQRAVLASLLLRAGQVTPTTRIIDDVWGDNAPDSAANLVQGYVSGLRKELGRHTIETKDPGYVLWLAHDRLDLREFERLANDGNTALEHADAEGALRLFTNALALWRGPTLSDLPDDAPIRWQPTHLDELRLVAEERRIEAQIALGRAADAVAPLREMVAQHPTREHPRAMLMTALYQSGRQAEALEVYASGRDALVEQLGLEPSDALRRLQQAILRHDHSLGPARQLDDGQPSASPPRIVLVAALDAANVAPSLRVALAMTAATGTGPWEVVVALSTADPGDLPGLSDDLAALRASWPHDHTALRTAAFTSVTPGRDLAQLAKEQDACVVIVTAPERVLEDDRLMTLLEQAPSDVAVVVDGAVGEGSVLVPFSGGTHDWAAVELAALLARSLNSPLLLLGAQGSDGKDASRLLASASLATQRALGIPAEPRIVEPGVASILSAAEGAGVVAVGLSDRWTRDGLGPARTALAASPDYPTILVRRGTRPSALSGSDAHTRFTWTAQ